MKGANTNVISVISKLISNTIPNTFFSMYCILACIVIGIEQYMMYCDWDWDPVHLYGSGDHLGSSPQIINSRQGWVGRFDSCLDTQFPVP